MKRAALAFIACIVGVVSTAAHASPGFDDVRAAWRSSDWVLLARDGETLARTRIDTSARRGDWIALADVSPALREAIVVSEDKRFYEHAGVDWRGAAAAAWGNLWNTRTRGASTVTMQLTGLIDSEGKPAGRRSIGEKAQQTIGALWLERSWRKDQILEAYLNLVPFRGEIVGLSALSQTLFGKAPSGLDEREAALAAALVRAPNAPYPKVAARACAILRDMQALHGARGGDPCVNLSSYVQLALTRTASTPATAQGDDALAPHLARRIASEAHPAAGARVRSTVDARLQRFTRDTLARTLAELNARAHPRNVHDAAAIVIDNRSGDVLAWVGSAGGLSNAPQVDAVLAARQAGSTLKPFLYAQAIDEKRVTAATLLDDAPLDLATGGGLYIPQNYDHDFKGWVSVRTALGSSLNVPAVRTLVMVTPHRFAKTLVALGLQLTKAGDYYGFSLALGSADVTLATLANAYRTLANGGLARPVFDLADHRPAADGGTRVFSAEASFIVTDILADNNARTRTFGFDSVLATRTFSAVKTGTSKDMRDNWAVGFTSRYTVGVWVGNADGAPMWDVSGVTGAAPAWNAIVNYLNRRSDSSAPRAPAGVIATRVTYQNDIEPARGEWFVRGTQMSEIGLTANAAQAVRGAKSNAADMTDAAAARIGAPTNGTIFALDPDIPPARQRVWFERAGSGARLAWRLDGKPYGHDARAAWLPWPGRHVLELVDAKGDVVDKVSFEVRGAFAKTAASR
ncbi:MULTISPECIES: penicillin-binding protein 1C [unclassified Caballeronia]|uniref:penicillin-binding protein 1C n=1 Tax=unclassified Caballeronia TaxID=2646786 RepID=UPI001F3627A4|nr:MULTISPECIES: penicillin-binding protein 1C [unclassified Caballeronia]MCE4541537.1 penicillin-binding protein 1C [Caballeronia sp. PC1]MCE4569419.1 penicillin-binding protein 1C [Caballeronia sp. CLC5]